MKDRKTGPTPLKRFFQLVFKAVVVFFKSEEIHAKLWYIKASNESAIAIQMRKWQFLASMAIMPSMGSSTATSYALAYFLLSSNITVTIHTISGLIWPLLTTIGMRYRCFITRAPHSFQREKNLLSLPVEDYWVS